MFPYIGKPLNYTVSTENEWQPPPLEYYYHNYEYGHSDFKDMFNFTVSAFDICRLLLIMI